MTTNPKKEPVTPVEQASVSPTMVQASSFVDANGPVAPFTVSPHTQGKYTCLYPLAIPKPVEAHRIGPWPKIWSVRGQIAGSNIAFFTRESAERYIAERTNPENFIIYEYEPIDAQSKLSEDFQSWLSKYESGELDGEEVLRERALRLKIVNFINGEFYADVPETEDDGFGMVISTTCPECGLKLQQVVRPGKSQCGLCAGNIQSIVLSGEGLREKFEKWMDTVPWHWNGSLEERLFAAYQAGAHAPATPTHRTWPQAMAQEHTCPTCNAVFTTAEELYADEERAQKAALPAAPSEKPEGEK